MSDDKRLADNIRTAVIDLEHALNAAGKEKLSIHFETMRPEMTFTDGSTGSWRVPVWCKRVIDL